MALCKDCRQHTTVDEPPKGGAGRPLSPGSPTRVLGRKERGALTPTPVQAPKDKVKDNPVCGKGEISLYRGACTE